MGIFKKAETDLIAWKVAEVEVKGGDPKVVIVKLLIPKRTMMYVCEGDYILERKCRAAGARVLSIQTVSGRKTEHRIYEPPRREGFSLYGRKDCPAIREIQSP